MSLGPAAKSGSSFLLKLGQQEHKNIMGTLINMAQYKLRKEASRTQPPTSSPVESGLTGRPYDGLTCPECGHAFFGTEVSMSKEGVLNYLSLNLRCCNCANMLTLIEKDNGQCCLLLPCQE